MKKVIRLSESQLNKIVKGAVKDIINIQPPKQHILSEGVQYDNETNTFTFDFEHDNETDIIKLEHIGKKVNAFGRCFYYGYEFAQDVDSQVRTEFIKSVKFPESFDANNDLKLFIQRAVDYLDSEISLPSYNVVVYPQSLSEINRKMLSYLSRITTTQYITIELVKEVASKIEFDYERFDIEILQSKTQNGQPRYTQSQKKDILSKIQCLMEKLHQHDYFSIARDIKKSKYRQYIKNYYKFPDEKTKLAFQALTNSNVILIDDIVTSGTTMFHMLNTLRCVNDSNAITIFSLIGKNNLSI